MRWGRHVFNPWVRNIPWRRAWQPTSEFFPGECHGQRSLVGYSPWGHKELDRTEATEHAFKHTLFSIAVQKSDHYLKRCLSNASVTYTSRQNSKHRMLAYMTPTALKCLTWDLCATLSVYLISEQLGAIVFCACFSMQLANQPWAFVFYTRFSIQLANQPKLKPAPFLTVFSAVNWAL